MNKQELIQQAWEEHHKETPTYLIPNPSADFEVGFNAAWEHLSKKLNPRLWSKADSDAWHRAIPDLNKAFSALRDDIDKEEVSNDSLVTVGNIVLPLSLFDEGEFDGDTLTWDLATIERVNKYINELEG